MARSVCPIRPLDGEGARLAGGRWNSSGRAVVYMAESVALAVLENLVHRSRQDFPVGYVCVAAVIPDGMDIATEPDLRLRVDLRELSSQGLGDWWIDSKESAVLEAPSALVAGEHLYLLDLAHPDFARIVADPPAPFHFDPRLFRE